MCTVSKVRKQGFTLVELAISMTVVALLAGGIMAASNLIRASDTNALIRASNETRSSILRFRESYQYNPGDFNEALTLWPTYGGIANVNGNGDGLVVGAEVNQVWMHLNSANSLVNSYVGGLADTPLSGGKFMFLRIGAVPSGPLPRNTNQLIFVGNASTAAQLNPVLDPREAYEIDLKADDGMPLTGSVIGSNGTAPPAGCVIAGAYVPATQTRVCMLVFGME